MTPLRFMGGTGAHFLTDRYTIKAYFWTILETVKKWNVYTDNESGTAAEQCFRGCQGEDLTLFLDRWLKIRKYLRKMTNNPEDLLLMDTRLFSGLHAYFQMMRGSMEQLEQFLLSTVDEPVRKSTNITCCAAAVQLGDCEEQVRLAIREPLVKPAKVSSIVVDNGPVSQAEMEAWIQRENLQYFPDVHDKVRALARKVTCALTTHGCS